ncbi:hypothetical protein BMI86_10265 [Thioclava sp. DLFJ5-1]|uniref:hypothetical protein n=1 Tax=Thioclava sp. DLFJ5-1 TaxID=1915314 RepID=UPI000997356C|nr:hypothetical protein [Thioclava sp. DLFJ5-1]OOY20881.1 hypothetical protein BMI86_10265 [Thioclava sp. DLFJ5-1]
MWMRNVKISQPVRIRVGDLEISIFKIGERSARIGVDAPDGQLIVLEEGLEHIHGTPKPEG